MMNKPTMDDDGILWVIPYIGASGCGSANDDVDELDGTAEQSRADALLDHWNNGTSWPHGANGEEMEIVKVHPKYMDALLRVAGLGSSVTYGVDEAWPDERAWRKMTADLGIIRVSGASGAGRPNDRVRDSRP